MSIFKKVRIEGKSYDIVWGGLQADRIMLNYNNDHSNHPFIFVEIQNNLSNAEYIIDTAKNKIAYKFDGKETRIIVTPIILTGNLVVPKTSFYASFERLTKHKKKIGISAIEDFWTKDAREGFYDAEDMELIYDAEKAMERIAKRILKKILKKA
jgi:hypothetical protein